MIVASIGFAVAIAALMQVRSGLLEGRALGVGARQLFDEGDVALRNLHVDRGELHRVGTVRAF
ncbi:MAG: hypothetical protein KatS3mg065_1120 [Chloroflexota bacterium]|nr:MAG: hypothetical protein KatS3mg065_1120 [Chloroflexota bacterium]